MRRFGLVFSLLAGLSASAQGDLIFNISSTGNAQADAAFAAAGDFWSSIYDDDVTINITAGFASLSPGVLGQAGSTRVTTSFSNFRAALQADISSADDATFAGALPTGSAFSVYINETTEGLGPGFDGAYVDNDGGANNQRVTMTSANAKALGLLSGTDTIQDVAITFSSSFSWDFVPADGIAAGLIDFVGVAIHEIGHGLGFISGVDVLDRNDDGAFSDDAFTFVSPVDFARFSADSLNAGADIDWTADNRSKFYSIDGGLTAGGGLVGGTDHWSRGVVNGDGRQASHWKDNLGLGILDPTARPAGQLNVVTDLDLQSLDIIGWDRAALTAVPEPSTLAAFAFGLSFFVCRQRRRRKQADETNQPVES